MRDSRRANWGAAIAMMLVTGLSASLAYYCWSVWINPILRMQKQLESDAETEYLGGLLGTHAKARAARAYHDPEEALRIMDRIPWVVPTVPTPFVGTAPRPNDLPRAAINAMQMRSPVELATPKPETEFRIFLTGGSTAYGNGAPDHSTTIGGYLQRMLNLDAGSDGQDYAVWTLANSAWASTHERVLIENRLSELDPDLVISFSGNNDVHWGYRRRNVLWFRPYQEESNWRLLDIAYQRAGNGPIVDVTDIDREPVPPEVVTERLLKNLRLSAYALSLEGTPYVFALQPTLAVTRKSLSHHERRFLSDQRGRLRTEELAYFVDCYRRIGDALEKARIENLHYIDLTGVFDGLSEEETYFVDSYHFGDKGYELVAGALLEALRDGLMLGLTDRNVEGGAVRSPSP